jgi:HK97 family phage portal protein
MILKWIQDAVKRALDLPTEKVYSDSPYVIPMDTTYQAISTVSRCVDIIISCAAQVDFKAVIEEDRFDRLVPKKPQLMKLLNDPSFEIDKFQFKKNIYRDLIFKGSCLIYNTRQELQILKDYQYINDTAKPYYLVGGSVQVDPDDCIMITLLPSQDNIFARPYIQRISKELDIIGYMLKYQQIYFKNNGIPGVILQTERPMSSKMKERLLEEYKAMTSIIHGNSGAPYILDNGMDLKELQSSFKELQFSESIDGLDTKIINGLGVPEVLVKGGNNANIAPNIKLFYYTTIADLVESTASAFTLHLHKQYTKTNPIIIKPDWSSVLLLKDDDSKVTNNIKTLYSVGLITKNEAREGLRLPKIDSGDEFLEPQNIAGSAVDPSEGGRPTEESTSETI